MGDWEEHRLHVNKELDRLANGQECILQKIGEIRVQVAMLKVKSGVWGVVGGLCSITVLLLVQWMRGQADG